jgi:phenylalanyl-tRNA synthetase alpha chain
MSKSGPVFQRTKKFGVYSSTEHVVQEPATKNQQKSASNSSEKVAVGKGPITTTASSLSGGELEQLILSILDSNSEISDTWAFAESQKLEHQTVVGAIKSLLVDSYVVDEPISSTFWELTAEGTEIATKGSAEFQVFQAVPEGGINVGELNAKLGDVAKIGMGPCMKNKWLKKEGENIVRLASSVEDETANKLSAVAKGDNSSVSEEDLKNLKKRKLVNQVNRKSYRITKGPEFQPQRVRKVAELTKDMLGNKADVS